MTTIQLYAAYWQDLGDVQQPGALCYGWAPLGKKPSLNYSMFDRKETTSFDAWMIAVEKMIVESSGSDFVKYGGEIVFEIVVHESLTRNEHRSIATLLKLYQRLTAVEVDLMTIATAQRVVAKGRKRTEAVRIKQRMITWMLKNKINKKPYTVRYSLVKRSTSSETKDRLVTCYDNAISKAQAVQTNVIPLRSNT